MNREQLLIAMQPIHYLDRVNYSVVALVIGMILVMAMLSWRLLRRPWLRWLTQRAALVELLKIEQSFVASKNQQQLAQSLSRLLRRYALIRFEPSELAGLSGQQWLDFLDRHSDSHFFATVKGAILITAPYQRSTGFDRGEFDSSELVQQVRCWIRYNR